MYIENPAVFRILGFLEPKIYSELFQGICCHIQNAVQLLNFGNPIIFRIWTCLGPKTYSEPCLFRHIHAYAIMIVTITLSFTLILHIFHRKLKSHMFEKYWIINTKYFWIFDYLQLTIYTRPKKKFKSSLMFS